MFHEHFATVKFLQKEYIKKSVWFQVLKCYSHKGVTGVTGGWGNRDALLFLVLTGITVFQKNWKNIAKGVKISNFKKKVTSENVFVRNTKLCLANILKIVEQSYYLSTLQRFLQNRKIALHIYIILSFSNKYIYIGYDLVTTWLRGCYDPRNTVQTIAGVRV